MNLNRERAAGIVLIVVGGAFALVEDFRMAPNVALLLLGIAVAFLGATMIADAGVED